MKIKTLTIVLTAFFACPKATAQQPDPAEVYNGYWAKNLHEKLFVHTDKPTYLAGEITWFKLYYVNAADNKPLSLSKVAYVDILDKNQVPVLQAKIALENGTGNGSLYLPVTLAAGNYKLRAYTNWMKNFGPGQFFEKQLTIINPLRSPEGVKQVAAAEYDIQFFPEGGNIIVGFENNVGFRIAGKNGIGLAYAGAVIDQKNDTVARFNPLKSGLGSFKFTPLKGSTYRAVVKTPVKQTVLPLEIATGEAYGMQVKESGNGKLNVVVNTNDGSGRFYLITYGTGKATTAQEGGLNNGSATIQIDKEKLSAGVNHILVFNANRQPVAERLYYVRPSKGLTVSATPAQATYTPRSRATINFNSTTSTSSPVKAMLSMSVYKIDSLQQPDEVDIQNYLWLTSELKGNIESPGYYFSADNAQTNAALDNLMLTQGWRQFSWPPDMANANTLKFLPEYNGHLITGHIYKEGSNEPAMDKIVYLSIPAKRPQMYPALSDSTGKLLFNTRDMFGPSEVVVQTNPDIDTTSRIEIASPFSEQYSPFTYPALQLKNAAVTQLADYSLSMQLQNVYLAQKIRQFYDPGVDSTGFYFTPFKTYRLDDFTRFTTTEEVLREYVTEVNVYKSKNRFHLRTLGENGITGDDPLVLVDGVPVFNANNLMAIDPLKIQKLDVVRDRYFYGPTSNEGIFSFISYKGNLAGLEINPHAVVLDYEGLQLQRKFYSPVYDNAEAAQSRIPDFRNVLYWLPVADTNTDGKNTATFYTSDRKGKYICVIEGITQNGEAGVATATFEVR